MESIYRIMRLGNVVLVAPGVRSPLFADQRAIQHFPLDLLDALGEPVVIGSGAEIVAAIEEG